MFGRLFVFSTAIAILLACAPSGGLLVSEKAEPIGGNLFVETTDSGDQFLVLDGEIIAEENESVVHSAASDKLNTLFMIVTP